MTPASTDATLELGIRGPALSTTVTLPPSGPDVVLGRDTDCEVCLPDPQRNVSRRHLAVKNVGGVLHFRVLSTVNGIWLSTGEVRPGGAGSLAPGQALRLGDYEIVVALASGTPAPRADDPWAELETQAGALEPTSAGVPLEDPFGDWFARSTFGPGVPGEPALDATTLGPARDLVPFLRGLGLDPEQIGPLTEGELQQAGVLARRLVEGLLQLRQAAGVAPGASPLRADAPLETVLRYLFGGRAAAAGSMPPLLAVNELLDALRERVARAPQSPGASDAAD